MKRLLHLFFIGTLLLSGCARPPKYVLTCQKHLDKVSAEAPFAMPRVALPSIPAREFCVCRYGADPTGNELCTEALQQAIDDASAAGGGTVKIPAGIYLTGPIVLKSNVRLWTEPNALIIFSDDFSLYPLVDASFEGLDTKRVQSPISAFQAENIAISGFGTFDGNGYAWRPLKKGKVTASQWKQKIRTGVVDEEKGVWFPDSAAMLATLLCQDQNVPVLPSDADEEEWLAIRSFLRPVMVNLIGCKNVLLEGVCFENSPAWNLHPLMCENVVLSRLNVRNPWYSQNGDGVDVESCKNVIITDCTFDVGDDAICMKSGKNEDGRRRGIPAENICVNNCTVYHGHGGFVVGSEMSGGVKNISVDGCTFIGTDVGLRFKSTRGRGGVVENIFVKNIFMTDIPNEALVFDLFYGGKGAGEETDEEIAARMAAAVPVADETTPAFRDITIENVTCKGAKRAIYFNGLPEQKIQNVTLRNIFMTADEGALFNQTDELVVSGLHITPAKGEPLVLAPTVSNATIED